MDTVFYWTGALVWCGMTVLVAMLLYEVGTGFVRTCSWVRWVLAVTRVHGGQLKWYRFHATFLHHWWEFTTHGRGDITMHGEGGYWRGIGDWGVHPKKSSNAAELTGASGDFAAKRPR